jgi:hypothetical protein
MRSDSGRLVCLPLIRFEIHLRLSSRPQRRGNFSIQEIFWRGVEGPEGSSLTMLPQAVLPVHCPVYSGCLFLATCVGLGKKQMLRTPIESFLFGIRHSTVSTQRDLKSDISLPSLRKRTTSGQ